jgi:formylglycine-generating enzyme required for sulfatase activity
MNQKTWATGLPLVILLALIITVSAYSATSGHVEAHSTTATPIPAPIPTGSSNDDWTSVVQEFDGVEMVFVPAGCFVMGSDDRPFSNEKPAHEVCLDGFWIDRYEATNPTSSGHPWAFAVLAPNKTALFCIEVSLMSDGSS